MYAGARAGVRLSRGAMQGCADMSKKTVRRQGGASTASPRAHAGVWRAGRYEGQQPLWNAGEHLPANLPCLCAHVPLRPHPVPRPPSLLTSALLKPASRCPGPSPHRAGPDREAPGPDTPSSVPRPQGDPTGGLSPAPQDGLGQDPAPTCPVTHMEQGGFCPPVPCASAALSLSLGCLPTTRRGLAQPERGQGGQKGAESSIWPPAQLLAHSSAGAQGGAGGAAGFHQAGARVQGETDKVTPFL